MQRLQDISEVSVLLVGQIQELLFVQPHQPKASYWKQTRTRTLETLTSTRFPSSSILMTHTPSCESSGGSTSRRLFSRANNNLMINSKTIHVTEHMPNMVQGTWLLDTVSAVVDCRTSWPTHRGLYLAFHMNGPAALPMQYADSMMAFDVTFFVCPAVVCDSQLKANTSPTIPIANYRG